VVHVTGANKNTRAQKVVSHTVVRITESVFAHDQPWEEQNTLTALLTFCMLGLYTLHTHFLLHKSNTKTRTPKPCTNNYCGWSPTYRSVE